MTTVEDPDGTGITFNPQFITELHSFSFIGCYGYSDFLMDNGNLSMGLQLNVDYLYVKEQISRADAKVNDIGFSGKLGINYILSDFISLGILYDKGSYIKSEMKYEGSSILETLSNESSVTYFAARPVSQRYIFEMPDKFSYGLLLTLLEHFYFSLTILHIYWNRLYSSFDNSMNISSNVLYKIPYFGFDFTCGFYDNKQNSSLFDFDNDIIFLNLGIRQNFDNSVVSVEISDGYSSEWHRLNEYFISLNTDFIVN